MLEVVLEDVAGSVRCASVWPPLIHEEYLWAVGTVLSILGLAPRRRYNSFTITSDCVCRLDPETDVLRCPSKVAVIRWPSDWSGDRCVRFPAKVEWGYFLANRFYGLSKAWSGNGNLSKGIFALRYSLWFSSIQPGRVFEEIKHNYTSEFLMLSAFDMFRLWVCRCSIYSSLLSREHSRFWSLHRLG